MQRIILALISLCCAGSLFAQQRRPLNELINKEDPGWVLVQQWIKAGKNQVEVLPRDSAKAANALLETQVTTRSPMGAIIYETGGILVDSGWIRILGSGSKKLNRSVMEWNLGKSYKAGQRPSFLLIADDVLGGFYAINNGALSKEGIGKIFYFAPDNMEWEGMDMSYTEFLNFCFNGNLGDYYKSLRWSGWQKEVAAINGNQGIHVYPFLWTKEGKNIAKDSRAAVPIQELWDLYFPTK